MGDKAGERRDYDRRAADSKTTAIGHSPTDYCQLRVASDIFDIWFWKNDTQKGNRHSGVTLGYDCHAEVTLDG